MAGQGGGQGPHIKGLGGGGTLATFDGLGEGVGALPLVVGGAPPPTPPPLPHAPALWAFSPWAHTTGPTKQLHHAQFEGGHTHPPGGCPPPPVQLLPHVPPSVLPRCFINEAEPQQKTVFALGGGGYSSQTNTKKPQPFPPQPQSAIWPFPPQTQTQEGRVRLVFLSTPPPPFP